MLSPRRTAKLLPGKCKGNKSTAEQPEAVESPVPSRGFQPAACSPGGCPTPRPSPRVPTSDGSEQSPPAKGKHPCAHPAARSRALQHPPPPQLPPGALSVPH